MLINKYLVGITGFVIETLNIIHNWKFHKTLTQLKFCDIPTCSHDWMPFLE